MGKILISKELSDKVLMIGVYWKNHAPGGVSSVVNTYAEYFEGINYIVTTASRDECKIKKTFVGITGLFFFLCQMVFNKRIQIVHVQGSHGTSFDRKKLFVKIAKMFDKKVVWHMHASQFVPFYESRKDKEEIVHCLNMSDTLIVLSHYYKDFYMKIGVRPEKIIILDNIVPYPDIRKESELYDGKRNLHILFLGEISQRKGAFDLIKAIETHSYLRDKINIRIGGNGEVENLHNAILNSNLEDCITFEGWVDGEKKVNLLNWADVYILPSYNEGLPISILEALSYNCPIISTPVGGIPEVVITNNTSHNKQNGILVEPGDIDQIAASIHYYIENPEQVEIQGKNSGKIVEKYYPKVVFSNLKEIYMNLL